MRKRFNLLIIFGGQGPDQKGGSELCLFLCIILLLINMNAMNAWVPGLTVKIHCL